MSALQPREVYRRLWRYGRPYRRLLALAFSCMTVLGLTTGALAYLAGPALRFLLTGRIDSLGALGTFFPSLHALDREQALWGLPLIIVSIGVVKGIAYLGQFYWMGLYGQRVGLDLRRDLFTKLSTLSPHQLAQARVGDLLNRFTADVSSVETAATYALASYVRDGLQILVLALVAVTSSWKLALALLLLTPIAIFPAARLTRSFMRRSREGLQQMGELSAQVHEGLGGLKTIQAFNAQAAELSRFEGYSQAHRRAMTRAGWTRAAVPAVMEVLGAAENGITSVQFLASWPNVNQVVLTNNPVQNLAGVELLEVLRVLDVSGSAIRNLTPLAENETFRQGDEVIATRTPLDGEDCGDIATILGRNGRVTVDFECP